MKQTLKHYGPVAALLAGILAVATLLTALLGGIGERDSRPRVVATVYPLYLAAQNVIGNTDGVVLSALTGTAAGCLHDYQLSPADRLAVEQADRILLNGGGAETFLQELLAGRPAHTAVDTGAALDFLCGEHHHEEEHDHPHHEESTNEHVWTSPARYRQQVQAVTQALAALDPANKQTYLTNGAAYEQAIGQVQARLPDLTGRQCVVFHDSLAYLAQDMGLTVALTLNSGEESGLSAADLAAVQQLAQEDPTLLLLYDAQYPMRYSGIDGLVPARQVLALETGVTGGGKPTDWLDAMERNLTQLQRITEGG